MVEYKHVKDHIEVYRNREFLFSADTIEEAHHDLSEMEDENG